MKTTICSLLLLGIVAVSGGQLARAADRPPLLRKGKVLILKNEYTMQGDIERIGDNYCVRRKQGENWVPAERVLALTASMEDAYANLHGRINLDDADERLRLARWCRTNGMMQQALTELRVAARLRPNHAETSRLLQYWQQTAAKTDGFTTNARNRESAAAQGVEASSHGGAAELPPIEVTSDSLGMFATRVQPILMNTCARCHATGRGGQFQLRQVYEDNISNRQTLERNLAAVLAEINVNDPETSRLLLKAVSDHAHTGQAPLRDRQSAPYRTLETWVKLTIANNPQLRDRTAPAVNNPASPPLANVFGGTSEPRKKGRDESEWGADARLPSAEAPAPVARGEKAKGGTNRPESKGEAGASSSRPPVADPYDPELFNRKMNPEGSKSGPEK
jgi:hypothetical protein